MYITMNERYEISDFSSFLEMKTVTTTLRQITDFTVQFRRVLRNQDIKVQGKQRSNVLVDNAATKCPLYC